MQSLVWYLYGLATFSELLYMASYVQLISKQVMLHSRVAPVLHLHSTLVFTEIQKSVPAETQSEHVKGFVVVAV